MGENQSTSNWKQLFDRNHVVILLGVSTLSLLLYLILAARYPLGASLADPRATWVSLNGGDLRGFSLHLVVYLGLTVLYALALKLLAGKGVKQSYQHEEHPGRRRWIYGLIVGSWLVFSLVLMSSAAAGESHDIFDYVFRGRMMVESNANPLVEVPRTYRKEAFIRYVAWQKNVDTYGPLWEMVSFGVSDAVHQVAQGLGWDVSGLPSCPKEQDSCRLLIAYLVGYRTLAVVLTGLCAGWIASMVKRQQPGLALAALVAWLWNPLVLISSAIGGHNDLLMIFLFLAGLWLMQQQRPFFSLLLMILAVHVKLTALIWVPLFVLWILRKWGWRHTIFTVAGSLLVGLGISWLLYLPFTGWSSLPGMLHERTLYLANSLWQVLYTYLYKQQGWQKEDVLRLTTDLPTWMFLVIGILLSLWMLNFRPKRWRRQENPDEEGDSRLWASLSRISLLYLVLAAFWFQHWYFLWVIAPAALLPNSKLTQYFVPWLSFGSLSANLAQGFLLEYAPKENPRTGFYLLTVMIIWGPALLAGIYLMLMQRLRSRLSRRRLEN